MKNPTLFSAHDEPVTATQTASGDAKSYGAFYTDSEVADFLTWWAIRSSQDTVLDPSFGGGVFLRSAVDRLRKIGGAQAGSRIYGVEIDPVACDRVATELVADHGLRREQLILSDFFDVPPGRLLVDAVVGNPPFIRYQRFSGRARELGLARSAARGVKLPALASSWAPFLVHSTAMLKPGGRLAIVLPMELAHAKYALPILQFLGESFGMVTLLTFRKKLFPNLSEDTLLLLADNHGASTQSFRLKELPGAEALAQIRAGDERTIRGTCSVPADALGSGAHRLISHLIPEDAQRLYRRLEATGAALRLSSLADVGIGYVSGANDFFHLTPEEARARRIPDDYLRPAVRRGRALSGLSFTRTDWDRAATVGDAGFLLYIGRAQRVAAAVRAYIEHGESLGVHQAYKCRVRTPWYCVPHVRKADAFLSYMSGSMPRLVANEAGAYSSNSLHVVRLRPTTEIPGPALAALWQTSLTRLSVELEGHPLGGGMLKLEPKEAGRVLIPYPEGIAGQNMRGFARELDGLARSHGDDAVRAHADERILRGMLGLSRAECDLLSSAAAVLRERRGYREVADGAA